MGKEKPDNLFKKFEKTAALWAAVEASRDKDGKPQAYKAMGILSGMGYNSVQDLENLSGILGSQGAFHDSDDSSDDTYSSNYQDDSWRDDCEDGDEYQIDPEDYESEDEYHEVLEEAQNEAELNQTKDQENANQDPRKSLYVIEWREKYKDQDHYGYTIDYFFNEAEFVSCMEAEKKKRAEEQAKKQPEQAKEQAEEQPEVLTTGKDDQREYLYCSVEFPFTGKHYHYRTEDETIKAGDEVIVPLGMNNRETQATVISVDRYTLDTAPYPVEITKLIIEKIPSLDPSETRTDDDGIEMQTGTNRDENNKALQQPQNKRSIWKIALVSFLIFLFIWFFRYYLKEDGYRQAIDLVKNARYDDAQSKLEDINQENYYGFIYHFKDGPFYKDSRELYLYASAQELMDSQQFYPEIDELLDEISDGYTGELHKEIADFKKTFSVSYAQYQSEQIRLKEETRASYADKLPFVGMEEEFIDDTLKGSHDKYQQEKFYDCDGTYHWLSRDGNTVLIVSCKDGYVSGFLRHNVNTYWLKNGKPNFVAIRSSSNSSSKKTTTKTKQTDPYNATEYSDAEDFYDDHYDDFESYEDAEDYYDDYGE